MLSEVKGWKPYHVEIVEGHARCEIVFVKHAFKLLIEQCRAFIVSGSSPWIECASLELNRSILCQW
jgi:hypothetical protein